MVFCRTNKMASDHPAKKKLKITSSCDDENTDETDFITEKIDTTNLLSLELSLPNADERPVKNSSLLSASGCSTNSTNPFCTRPGDGGACTSQTSICAQNGCHSAHKHKYSPYYTSSPCKLLTNVQTPRDNCSKLSAGAAHSSSTNNKQIRTLEWSTNSVPRVVCNNASATLTAAAGADVAAHRQDDFTGMRAFETCIVKQCLCGISESTLRIPFQIEIIDENGGERVVALTEWPVPKILQFLSNLQLLFDVFLKQNNKGFVCSKLLDICTALVLNEHNLIEQIFSLINLENKIVHYLTSKVLASYFILAKTNIDNSWLDCVTANLNAENDYNKLNFNLEIIRRIVEWKDVDIHVLEEEQIGGGCDEAGVSGASRNHKADANSNCRIVALTDHESFDTSPIKCLIIKKLEPKWPELVKTIEHIITNNFPLDSECCVINFLSLWESIISVRANLSVVETKPFYAHLEKFVSLLHFNLPFLIWRQFLSLFNEVLCYGSTLALQDILPEETCALAHLVVRYVKDFRLLDSLPYKRVQAVSSLIGTDSGTQQLRENYNNVDKTLLQKMALLVLKSVAITVKETRSDSSDSSVGSDDYDFNQDMQLIERSIRDVLKKLDSFIKTSLDYHPECAFTKVLIHLFSDQDDYMIESMVCTLDITVGIFYRNSVFPDLIIMLNPFNTFVEFLKIVSLDSDVLLDYLVSNETCFLLYLLRFLKYVRRNWSKFVHSCETRPTIGARTERGGLDATMSVLIRLRLQINRLVAKQLFPYNITPVLRLLETCESLYEGNEYT